MQMPDAPRSGAGLTRREVLKRGSAFAAAAAVPSLLAARPAAGAGSTIKIGFIALTDCSSVVMAHELGHYKKRGLDVQLIKQASWPATRDALLNGDIDMCHGLFSLPLSVALGIGGSGSNKIKVAMMLNQNGQAITLKKDFASAGYGNLKTAKAAIKGGEGQTFAMTFPGGTHDTWLRYWLKAMGIDMSTPKIIPIPPPQMVANMQVGNMDGFCVGEPWNYRAIMDRIGFTANTTQDLWKDHPEKTLGCTAEFVEKYPNTARAMTAAVIDAGRWIDASLSNRRKTAETVADKSYVNTDKEVILARMLGRYDNGIGRTWDDPNYMKFYNDGYVTFPFLSDGMWFMTQHRRWGLLKEDVDYLAIAKKVNRIDLYKEAAAMTKTSLPKDPMRSAKLIDGVVWDGKDPKRYAGSFKIKVA